jgi:hypothetical protein
MNTASILGLWSALFVPFAFTAEQRTIGIVNNSDTRVEALSSFFRSTHSPLAPLAADFVMAADHNGLDWRLLAQHRDGRV